MNLTDLVPAQCPVFGLCGGCQYQDIPYLNELAIKESRLKSLVMAQLSLEEKCFLPIVPSARMYHYRSRLDLKLVHRRNGDIHIGFSPPAKGPVIEIEACPVAMEPISAFIPELRREACARIPKDYRMANLTVRCGQEGSVRWGGIGQKSLWLEARDYFYIDILGRRIFYGLDTFFQANLFILPALIDSLRHEDIWSKDAVFFDLYGGVGLFGLCVNDCVLKVFNIESNVHAVRLARYNISSNKSENVHVLQGRVEDVLPSVMAQEQRGDHILMVDPPRAGLSNEIINCLNNLLTARHLVYLSCDPESLALNLKDLVAGGWVIKSVRPFDFFPRTRHLETLVLLTRRKDAR